VQNCIDECEFPVVGEEEGIDFGNRKGTTFWLDNTDYGK
jgi:hypothetical protein